MEPRCLFESAPVGIAVVDATSSKCGRIVEANPAFAEIAGRARRDLEGRDVCELLHPDERLRGTEELARLIAGAAPAVDGYARLLRADGQMRWVRVNAGVLRDALGGAEGILMHVTDASELKRVSDERNDLATRLAEAQAMARIGSFEWSAATGTVEMSDELFRLYGLKPRSLPATLAAWEPFLHPDDVPSLMEAVVDTLADAEPRRFEFRIKPTTGGLRWAEGHFRAERSGGQVTRLRGTVQDVNDRKLAEMQLRAEIAEHEQATALRTALANGEFRLDGQDIIDLTTSERLAQELLIRRVTPDGRIVPAGEFLSLAERHGVILDIDRWVLEQAVDLAASGAPVAVNVSARTISDPAYAEAVVGLIDARGADPGLLTFEITETALVESFEHARRFALTLESLGCSLALDDFGTGYGALTYLKELPAQYLKIDREFVSDVRTNARSRAVIEGIVTLARSFGQQTIAEGVEDRAVLQALSGLGVDFVQGFYVGRPHWVAGAGRGRCRSGEVT